MNRLKNRPTATKNIKSVRTIQRAAACLAVMLATAGQVQADIIVANGDFESPSNGPSFTFDIAGWGESNALAYSDFLINGSDFFGAYEGGQTAGMEPGGYIYQEIGTPGNSPSLEVSGLNYWRDNDQMQRGDLTVQLFALDSLHPFSFAEFGNDILGVGALVGESTVAAPLSQGATVSFSESFMLSGLNPDDRLFLRFTPSPNPIGHYAYLDNVSATLTAVPEPSAVTLLGCASCGLFVARRTRSRLGSKRNRKAS